MSERWVYDVPDLAELLGKTPTATRRLLERGIIPSRRLGRSIVVLASELEECLRRLPRSHPRGLRSVVDDGDPGRDRPT